MVHTYSGILLSHKEWDHAICSYMDGSRDDHAEQSKSEGQIPYDVNCKGDLNDDTNELTYETDSQT